MKHFIMSQNTVNICNVNIRQYNLGELDLTLESMEPFESATNLESGGGQSVGSHEVC